MTISDPARPETVDRLIIKKKKNLVTGKVNTFNAEVTE